jgi:hypothetical protein
MEHGSGQKWFSFWQIFTLPQQTSKSSVTLLKDYCEKIAAKSPDFMEILIQNGIAIFRQYIQQVTKIYLGF